MKCPVCNHRASMYECDDGFICHECGAAFELEYIGMYEEGSDDLLASGHEPKEWKLKHKESLDNMW